MKIFDEQIARKPNRYPWTQEFIDAMWAGHWTPNEFDFKADIHDFKTRLTPEEQQIVIRTLTAIGQIEIAVKTFWARLGDNLKHPGLYDLGVVMSSVEVIHNIAYEKLITVLGLQEQFEANLKHGVIDGRVKYLKKYLSKEYTESKKQYLYSLILFTLFVENISLFSQFYIILWFGRYKNMLKDANQQVLYTKNEEVLHAQIGVKLVNVIRKEYPELFDEELEQKVIHEAKEAFKAESKIVDWILGDYQGERINADILKGYIQYKVDESLTAIGYKELYNVNGQISRDFEWMNEETLGNNMTDFFFKRPTEYSKKSRVISGEELFDDGK